MRCRGAAGAGHEDGQLGHDDGHDVGHDDGHDDCQ